LRCEWVVRQHPHSPGGSFHRWTLSATSVVTTPRRRAASWLLVGRGLARQMHQRLDPLHSRHAVDRSHDAGDVCLASDLATDAHETLDRFDREVVRRDIELSEHLVEMHLERPVVAGMEDATPVGPGFLTLSPVGGVAFDAVRNALEGALLRSG